MMTWGDSETAGVIVNVPDEATLMSEIANRFERGQGFSVATLNLDHVVKLSRDPAFQQAYQAQTYVTADGNPIVWLARLAGQKVSLVPGSEMIDPLAALAARHQVPVGLFGATPQALEAAARTLSARHPGLEIALSRSPAMGFDPHGAEADAEIKTMAASDVRLWFLALGAPKQEIFAARAQAALPAVGFASVGAGLDFIASTQKRAPAWVRAIAAEWLWRLLQDPKRLAARYLVCFAIIPGLMQKALRQRRQSGVQS